MGSVDPAGKTIGDIGAVAMRRDALAEVAGAVNRARVVESRRNVKRRGITLARLVDALGQPVPVVRTGGPLTHHASDDVLGAGVLHDISDITITGGIAVVVLHQTGVANTKV